MKDNDPSLKISKKGVRYKIKMVKIHKKKQNWEIKIVIIYIYLFQWSRHFYCMSKSIILSADDVKRPEIVDTSRKFFRSKMNITYSQTPKARSPIQYNQQKQQVLEDEIFQLKSIISKDKELNESLSKEINQVNNHLSVSNALCKQLKQEKENMVLEMVSSHKELKKIQDEKVSLLSKLSDLQMKLNICEKRNEYQEEHNQNLNHQKSLLHEELAFEKTLNSDLKQECLKLREQLKKIYNDLKEYEVLKLQFIGIERINKDIKEKFKVLQIELTETRNKLKDFEEAEEREQEERKKIFNKIEGLERENVQCKERNEFFQKEVYIKQKQIEEKYGKGLDIQVNQNQLIQEQKSKINTLIQEVITLSRKNNQFLDEIEFYKKKIYSLQNQNSFLPPNTGLKLNQATFASVYKSAQLELSEVKKRLDLQLEEKQKLQIELESQFLNSKNRKEEVQTLLKLKENEVKAKEQYFEKEIQELKSQNYHLRRRIDQMIEVQHRLRTQINDKDRIIMQYVKKK